MTTFSPTSLLVTGGAGFIGANFLHYLAKQDDKPTLQTVVNLDAETYAADKQFLGQPDLPNYTYISGSICDVALVNDLFAKHDFDCVIHFAAESHVDRSIDSPADFIQTNLVGTAVLLDVARQHWQDKPNARFHHISTDEVYGSLSLDDPAFTETTPYDPSSPYSASKAGSDHLVRAWHRTFDLPVTMSNCSNNFGPGQHAEKLIPTVIRHALAEQPIPIYGDGQNRRDWLFVEDHCDAIWQIVTRGALGETYNVGGGTELPNLDIAQRICAVLDDMQPRTSGQYADLITFVTDRAGHDWRYAIDCEKMNTKLNWQACHEFDSALRTTIAYYLSHQSD